MESGCTRGTLVKKPLSWLLRILVVTVVLGPPCGTYAQPQHPAHGAPPAHLQSPPAAPAPALKMHKILVRFDYDFDRTPACSTSEQKLPCVQRFVVYDISAGPLPSQRAQLFTIPLPPDPRGAKRGISQRSPPLLLERGRHLIAVSAQMPDNKTESFPAWCDAWVDVR
jgi:hypothetical protein